MAHDEQPLPRPPTTPFGRTRRGGGDEGSLTADRMAAAQAQGRLEELLARELPDNPRARELATMMLGMTGMAPPPVPAPEAAPLPDAGPAAGPAAGEVPPEVLAAVGRGDLAGVKDALRREHARRCPGAAAPPDPAPESPPAAPPEGRPAIDRETIDAMLRIAADNGVTPDWITFRAIKLYVEEYRKTGRL